MTEFTGAWRPWRLKRVRFCSIDTITVDSPKYWHSLHQSVLYSDVLVVILRGKLHLTQDAIGVEYNKRHCCIRFIFFKPSKDEAGFIAWQHIVLWNNGFREMGGNIENISPRWHNEWVGFWWHDDVIKWKHFPRYWPFVRGIHRWPVNSPHKGQWRGALMFSLISAWINGWVNNREAGDLRRHRAHCDFAVIEYEASFFNAIVKPCNVIIAPNWVLLKIKSFNQAINQTTFKYIT